MVSMKFPKKATKILINNNNNKKLHTGQKLLGIYCKLNRTDIAIKKKSINSKRKKGAESPGPRKYGLVSSIYCLFSIFLYLLSSFPPLLPYFVFNYYFLKLFFVVYHFYFLLISFVYILDDVLFVVTMWIIITVLNFIMIQFALILTQLQQLQNICSCRALSLLPLHVVVVTNYFIYIMCSLIQSYNYCFIHHVLDHLGSKKKCYKSKIRH